MNIKKIIEEEIENLFVDADQLKKDIYILKDFEIIKDTPGSWSFKYEDGGDSYILDIKNKDGKWEAEGVIVGRLPHESGEFKIRGYHSYEEMIHQVNNRTKNNPLISPDLLNDDQEEMYDDEVKTLLKQVIDNKYQIIKNEDEELEELKELLNIIENNTDKDLESLVEILIEKFGTKNALINVLRKVDQISFYDNMNDFIK